MKTVEGVNVSTDVLIPSVMDDELTTREAMALTKLIAKGYAVVVFHPDEFTGVQRDKLSLAMLDYGSHYIVSARRNARQEQLAKENRCA